MWMKYKKELLSIGTKPFLEINEGSYSKFELEGVLNESE